MTRELHSAAMQRGTFSIVAHDPKSGDFGVGSVTAAPCVGAFLPFAQEGVGAIASQAWVNVNLGYQGMMLMREGFSVKTALEMLLQEDEGRSRRQVIGVDRSMAFGYTGAECGDAKAQVVEKEFAVAGNILTSEGVPQAMAAACKKSKGELAKRLVSALRAGENAGGDKRGRTSAVLLVASRTPRLYHNIRVDMSPDPLGELVRIFESCESLQSEYGDDYDGEILRPRIASVPRKRDE